MLVVKTDIKLQEIKREKCESIFVVCCFCLNILNNMHLEIIDILSSFFSCDYCILLSDRY